MPENIDTQFTACGWIVQDRREINLYAGTGVAVREFPLETGRRRILARDEAPKYSVNLLGADVLVAEIAKALRATLE